jgi:Sel1 repeat
MVEKFLIIATVFSISAFVATASAQGVSTPALVDLLHARRLLQSGREGQGVRVGVISGGASSYAALVGEEALPGDVQFYGSEQGDGDEGDWMMQVVHQVAPRAQLAFCPGGPDEPPSACARQLITNFHAGIVVDDMSPQPVFDYPTPKVVGYAELAAERPNVLFFTGSGNNGGGYYERPWVATSVAVDGVSYAAQDFGRSVGEGTDPYDAFRLPPGAQVVVVAGTNLDPTGAPQDCDAENPQVTLALLDSQGGLLTSVSSHCPVLQLRFRSGGFGPQEVSVAVLLPAGADPQSLTLKLVVFRAGEGVTPLALRYRTAGGAGNSATARHLVAVAGVDPNSGWRDHYIYEGFANSGPQCLSYGGTGPDGWVRLPVPSCMQQPAFVTPDRTMVLMPGPDGEESRPFVGDSAAGPAAGGAAALLLSAGVPAGRILALLERTAIPQVTEPGWNRHYGYGLLDVDAAAVAAGVLARAGEAGEDAPPLGEPIPFHPTAAFLQYRQLSLQARQGDQQALAALQTAAQSGDPDAQTWLGQYDRGAGDNVSAARWTLAAAGQGQPFAQGFLGSMYNRGWGVPMDARAAQAWWLRAARRGIASAMYNIGTTIADGRGAPADPALGYALMRTALLRGFHFPRMNARMAELRATLDAQQLQAANVEADRFAANPSAISVP